MKRMRLVAWIVYTTCIDIKRPDGSFLIPRSVFRRVVTLDDGIDVS